MYVCCRGGCGGLIRPHPSCKNLHTYKSVPCLYICVRYINRDDTVKFYINQINIYKSDVDIYKSGRYLAKSVSYLHVYIRGRYTNIASVSVFDTFGTPYHTKIHTVYIRTSLTTGLFLMVLARLAN